MKKILIKIIIWLGQVRSSIIFVEFINNEEYIHKVKRSLSHIPTLGATVFFDTEKEYMVVRYVNKVTIGHKIYVVVEPTNKIPTTEDKNN